MCRNPTAECDERTNQQRSGRRPCHVWKDRAFRVRPTADSKLQKAADHACLRTERQPPRLTFASEGAMCGWRDAKQLEPPKAAPPPSQRSAAFCQLVSVVSRPRASPNRVREQPLKLD